MVVIIVWLALLTVGIIFIGIRLDKLWNLHKAGIGEAEDPRMYFIKK